MTKPDCVESGLDKRGVQWTDRRSRRTSGAGAAFDRPYMLMNILAAVIASYGLLANSPAVVIGAMIVAMLIGPITGISLSLVEGDYRLTRSNRFCVWSEGWSWSTSRVWSSDSCTATSPSRPRSWLVPLPTF